MELKQSRVSIVDQRTPYLCVFVSFPTGPFTDWLPNGDGLVAYKFVESLIARGHTVHVATPNANLRAECPKRLIIHQMNVDQPRSDSASIRYMQWVRSIFKIIMRHHHIDIIHELNPVFTALSLAFVGLDTPVILGPHSSRWPSVVSRSLWSRLSSHLTGMVKDLIVYRQHRNAKAILLSTPAALNNILLPHVLCDRLFILPPGIDQSYFVPDSDSISPVEPHSILFLANISRRKGIFFLLEAFQLVWQEMPAAILYIGGNGPDLSAVKTMVADSGFQNNVRFLGHVERSEIPVYMQRTSVYCLPSFGEPFGMTALEAMSCGKPLVVTEAGGLGYMVSSLGGRRVEPGNVSALASALLELLKDDRLRERMGRHNRRTVETSYAWPVIGEQLEEIYVEALGRRRATKVLRVDRTMIKSHDARQRNENRSNVHVG